MTRTHTSILVLALLWAPGCFDQGFHRQETDEDTACEGPGCDTALPQDTDTDTDTEPPEPPEPPDEVISDCNNPDATAVWNGNEIWVASPDDMTNSGTLQVSDTGWFHVYSAYSAESGTDQWNESAFYRFKNDDNPTGQPFFGNCGEEWVVRDSDNDQAWTGGDYIYLGTFRLVEGNNTLVLEHYCLLFNAGECQEFHITDEPSSTCGTENANSAHFSGELCLLTAGGTP